MADKYADRIADELLDYVNCWEGISSTEFYHRGFRSDVIFFNEDGVFIDFEIKTTVSDFWNDFNKTNKQSENRHWLFERGFLTEKFYFVFPPNLIPTESVPEIYGVIHYLGDGDFKVIRQSIDLDISENYDEILNSFALHLSKRNRFDELWQHSTSETDRLNEQRDRMEVDNIDLNLQIDNLKHELNKVQTEFNYLITAVEERYGYIDY